MSRARRPATADTMIQALRQVEELHHIRVVLDRYRIPTDDIDARITRLTLGPVKVQCYMCCKRTTVVAGLARATRPVCVTCRSAACDRMGCFTPASVSITTAAGTSVCCTVHGFEALPARGRALIRHLPDGVHRRAVHDESLARAS